MNSNSLDRLGWSEFFSMQISESEKERFTVGRICAEHKERYEVMTADRTLNAEVSGKLLFEASAENDFPKTGDWVLLSVFDDDSTAIIHRRLERKNSLGRNAPGSKAKEQILAVNVDTICIVAGLDDNFNPRRIERYLVNFAAARARQFVLLSKSDICSSIMEKTELIERTAPGVSVIPYSAVTGDGISNIKELLKPEETSVFLGSSGAGKSTLINQLFGLEIRKTAEVRSDSRGRHTTVTRELFVSAESGILIDTPGMRELQLTADQGGLSDIFTDIAAFSDGCKYDDCTHTVEPGCAVLVALNNGSIDEKRYNNYIKMRKEIAHYETVADVGKKNAEKKKWKVIHKEIKRMKKKR